MANVQQATWPIISKPGIKRDGTVFQGANYTDGQWVRWQRGLPRKIGGYRMVSDAFSGPVRGCYVYSSAGYTRVFGGSGSVLEFVAIDPTGAGSGIVDRTPVGFATSTSNVWQFDAMWNAAGTNTALIGHAAPNLLEIDNATAGVVYYGDISTSAVLATVGQSVSGGVMVLHPYLFIFGSNGQVSWSDANSPTNFATGDAGTARPTAAKIVAGKVTRGGPTNSPAGLMWSLDSVLRVSYVGSTAIFRFDTVSDQSSILSSSGVIEYDGLFFWPGVDRFLVYNGTVRELPNDMNINYFYDNLNWTYRQKVYATKVPRYGEIWWFYPRGTSTECNDAIIYNIRENTWYDAGIATGAGRSSGTFSQVFRYPLNFGTTANGSSKYPLWQHEFGVDEVTTTLTNAIPSFFETGDVAWADGGPGQEGWVGVERNVRLTRIEPDFLQVGTMSVEAIGRKFATSDEVSLWTGTFTDETEKLDTERVMAREMRLRFTSNVAGGDYQMGQVLGHYSYGDVRP